MWPGAWDLCTPVDDYNGNGHGNNGDDNHYTCRQPVHQMVLSPNITEIRRPEVILHTD
jgi:hypothetical protein